MEDLGGNADFYDNYGRASDCNGCPILPPLPSFVDNHRGWMWDGGGSIKSDCYVTPSGNVDYFCNGNAGMSISVQTKETSNKFDGFDYWSATIDYAYTYRHVNHPSSPWFNSISPRYGSAGDVFTISGANLGTSLKDYRSIYFGPGRPPQGGNLESNANSALCRVDELNAAANLDGEGELERGTKDGGLGGVQCHN